MSSNSISAPLPEAAGSVGLGYGIAIAVGILVLISTIMLASYVCVRVKGGPHVDPTNTDVPVGVVPGTDAAATIVTGLDGPTIDSYPKFIYGGPGGPQWRDDGTCPICLSDYRPEETVRYIPDCKHCFHDTCIDEWLRMSATCPLCRTSPVMTPVATPLSELIPLAVHAR
ncbi:putative RING-H2 finger protein ATL69 [Magnolia sinica]|uniref:putative RING-H2 finger protein ATL69 n=1 Tax=Magnolia sinica TaxID=86752 RepID=UPI00265873DC|nr:putative RING-H2 finger protein ATL69 [Magnolia sinica]